MAIELEVKKPTINIILPSSSADDNQKYLRMESGTITPAEDMKSITIPCSGGAKAFVLEATDDVLSAVEGQKSKRYAIAAVGNFAGSIDGAPNTALRIWNLKSYVNGGLVAQNTAGVTMSFSFYFYAGTYRWTAYYWEEE